MEILNEKERIKSILKWGLINLLLIGIIFTIFWQKLKIEKALNKTFASRELEYEKFKVAHENVFHYFDNKDSILLDFSSDATLKINPNGIIKLKSLHEDVLMNSVNTEPGPNNAHLSNNLVTFYKTIDAIEELKSLCFATPVITPGTIPSPKIVPDYSQLNKLRRKIKNDVDNHVLRQLGGLIHKNSLKKDEQSVENVRGLTIVRDNIINYKKEWMQ